METKILDINGIKTILVNLPESQSTTTQILVKAGSIYETKEINGISHFLEHMFFKG
jgi:predicted Zn-dependent peptidase